MSLFLIFHRVWGLSVACACMCASEAVIVFVQKSIIPMLSAGGGKSLKQTNMLSEQIKAY